MALRLHWVVFQCKSFEAYLQRAILMKEVVNAIKGLCKACVIIVPAHQCFPAPPPKTGVGHVAVDTEAGIHGTRAITVRNLISRDIHPPDHRDHQNHGRG